MSGQVVQVKSETRQEKKDGRIQSIIECGNRLMTESGIEKISLSDVSAKSKIE